jgi:hypothetical protein
MKGGKQTWSNTISAGTRESAQPRMAATGFCLGAIFFRRLRAYIVFFISILCYVLCMVYVCMIWV